MIDGKAVCGEQHVWQVWFDYITSLPEASSLWIALSGQAAAYVSEPISLSQGRWRGWWEGGGGVYIYRWGICGDAKNSPFGTHRRN
jgi:hypothetical protein